MKKIIPVIGVVLTISIIASCTPLPEPAQANSPSPAKVSPYQTHVTATATVQPSTVQPSPEEESASQSQATTTVTAQPSQTAVLQQLVKEDIPAYLTVGLDKRSEMPAAMERYYYGMYYYQVFITYGRDPTDDFSSFNVDFDKMTSVDLDGDGKKEAITLIGGKPFDSDYFDITIDIDGNQIKLGDGNKYIFELCGVILDVDKRDGKKEIFISASGMEEGWTNYIISYDNKKPRMIFDGQLFNPAEGTGYIVAQEVDHYIYHNVLWKLKDDRSGFEAVNNEYYPTHYQQYCWDENGSWDEGQAAETQSGQYLYKMSGGSEKVLVKKGTRVFVSLYAKNGRLMILDAAGNLLGWLDTVKVDINEYTGYAFELGYG